MNPPKKVRIGAIPVTVEIVNNLTNEGVEVDGTFGSGIIQLHGALAGTFLADAFLHEILHAITYFHHVGQDHFEEEQVVTRYSFPLTTFFADNPTARKWWCSLLR